MSKKNENPIELTMLFEGSKEDVYSWRCAVERIGIETHTLQNPDIESIGLLLRVCYADFSLDSATKLARRIMEDLADSLDSVSMITDGGSDVVRLLNVTENGYVEIIDLDERVADEIISFLNQQLEADAA